MDSRERVRRALQFQAPDRAPRDLWHLPGVELFRKAELEAMLLRYPPDFASPPLVYGPSVISGTPNRAGSYTDEWGCVWYAGEDGVVGEVKGNPLADWSALAHFRPPWAYVKEARFHEVDPFCAGTTRFVRGNSSTRLFERMQFLRGVENLYLDLAYLPPELYTLRDMLHEFYRYEIEQWAKTEVDAIFFMDDWGAQDNLLIAPELWREFFKPVYRDFCELIKGAGKFVFCHSDGFIEPILPDLIEIGVDAVNSQLFCMDIEQVAARHRGHITFWGEICRQTVLPFAAPDEVRAAVRRVRAALDDGQGGVIAQCEWGIQDPAENIAAVFEAWEE